jgi:hypothetical protein
MLPLQIGMLPCFGCKFEREAKSFDSSFNSRFDRRIEDHNGTTLGIPDEHYIF